MFLDLQFIQRAPIRLPLYPLLCSLDLFRLANSIAIPVAMRMRWEI
jgi:hypothetical protein